MELHNEINSCGDNEALQVDLNNVYSSRCIIKLSFNAGKCLTMTLTKKNSLSLVMQSCIAFQSTYFSSSN